MALFTITEYNWQDREPIPFSTLIEAETREELHTKIIKVLTEVFKDLCQEDEGIFEPEFDIPEHESDLLENSDVTVVFKDGDPLDPEWIITRIMRTV
jgi:hypothetical protein